MPHRFRLIAEVSSDLLGNILGILQMNDCTVLECNLIAEAPFETIVAAGSGRPPSPPQPKRTLSRSDGPTDHARKIIAAFPPGHVFRQKAVYDKLVQAGHGESSSRSAFHHALKHNPRVHPHGAGFYIIRDGTPDEPKPVIHKWRSTKQFVEAFIGNMKPGEEVTRKQIMAVGRAEGQSDESMNTIIYDAYAHDGLIERVAKGIYRKPNPTFQEAPLMGEEVTS